MKQIIKNAAFLLFLALSSFSCSRQPPVVIVYPAGSSALEYLSAREVMRYLYLRTGSLPELKQTDSVPSGAQQVIVVGTKKNILSAHFPFLSGPGTDFNSPDSGQYKIISWYQGRTKYLLICGGDDQATLYGAYRFAETLGVRFYLHGDVLPDKQISYSISRVNITGKPLFAIRGIQPFHDFPEGPDWWNINEYKAIIAQLPKMGMNFIGLHTYPENGPNAEPTVWIGEKSGIGKDEDVLYSYPSSYQNTLRGNWGYKAANTGDFHYGSRLLFENDHYGPDVMNGLMPASVDETGNNALFKRTGRMLNEAFRFAHTLGVKTCVGTETPLVVPASVKDRLRKEKKDPADPKVIRSLYEGIFSRIKQAYPVDYYWLWTPEGWTWETVSEKAVRATEADMKLALEAAASVKAPFTLATCGWVLGPPQDPARFDLALPKYIPFSCINRYVGFARVDPAFANIHSRSEWAIPWLEDDPGLTSPQLWAGRMRRDALDALRFGCNGLLGIHWRTQIIGPNVSALAKAAWSQDGWGQVSYPDSLRDIPVTDFYRDWAVTQFGSEAGDSIASVFIKLDGGPAYNPKAGKDYEANLYRPCAWIGGPGGIKINKEPWSAIRHQYDFISGLEKWQPVVKGPLAQERFSYWLETFRYSRDMAQLGCLLGEIENTMLECQKLRDDGKKRQLIENKAIPARIEANRKWGEMETSLLSALGTTGEMGTVANLEQHNFFMLNLLQKYDSLMTSISGQDLPAEAQPWKDYRGPERIIVPAVRTLLEKGEGLSMKVIILENSSEANADLYWRPIGENTFRKNKLIHLSRGVYTLHLKQKELNNRDFEYYIEAGTPSGKILRFPVSAPQINQTVLFFIDPAKP